MNKARRRLSMTTVYAQGRLANELIQSGTITKDNVIVLRLKEHVSPAWKREVERFFPSHRVQFMAPRTVTKPRLQQQQLQMQAPVEAKATSRTIDWQDYVGIVMPLSSPVNLFLRRQDVLQEKPQIHVIFYSMGAKKILVSGTWDKTEHKLMLDCSCNYKNGTELSERIRAWRANDFAIVASASVDHALRMGEKYEFALGRRPTREEYLVACNRRPVAAPSDWKVTVVKIQSEFLDKNVETRHIKKDYETAVLTEKEYHDAKLWVAFIHEPSDSKMKGTLRRELEATGAEERVLDEFYVQHDVVPEDLSLDPDVYARELAAFTNRLAERVDKYEKVVNRNDTLSDVAWGKPLDTKQRLLINAVKKDVEEAIVAHRFYAASRPTCATELECETGEDETCYFWHPVPELPSVEESLL